MSDTLSIGPSPPIISPVTEKLRISCPVPGTQWSDDLDVGDPGSYVNYKLVIGHTMG